MSVLGDANIVALVRSWWLHWGDGKRRLDMELIFVAEAGVFLGIMILWGVDIIRDKIWWWRWKRSDYHYITQIYRTPVEISPILFTAINEEL